MKDNKNEQETTITILPKSYDELDEKYQMAIDLRLIGHTHQYISGALSEALKCRHKESLIRQWFSKNGICDFAFRQKKKQRTQERKTLEKELNQQFTQAAVDCLPALRKKANRGSWQACEILLRYAGLEPARKNELLGKNGQELQSMVVVIPDNGRDKKN